MVFANGDVSFRHTPAKEPRLGEILVSMGKLTVDQVKELLLEQEIRGNDRHDPAKLLRYERIKKSNRLRSLTAVFTEAGNSSRELAESFMPKAVNE